MVGGPVSFPIATDCRRIKYAAALPLHNGDWGELPDQFRRQPCGGGSGRLLRFWQLAPLLWHYTSLWSC